MENISLKEKINVMNAKQNRQIENYKIEKMIVKTLEEYLKLITEDCKNIICEADISI